MMVVDSVVKLGLGKDKLESSKSKESGICKGNHEKDNGSGNCNDGGNGKPRVRKKKTNKKMGQFKVTKYLKKSTIKDDASKKEPKKLGLSKGKFEAKKAKRSKKKRGKYGDENNKVGPIRLNSNKAMELAELSARLPTMEQVSFVSELKEEVAMLILKLGSLMLTFFDTPEELPHLGKVGCASNFGKVVM
ncbi:hypothetical protein PVK06_048140 [Gossypium arboreum]|uniref:Uncharacterized protein n=1 Tax=Gossypium arboreum TaxID=29729 RepID=A0ABR0MF50_GOSAR|nr:hypothetical protein PVK06_048140 [Gossypium arboreum]